LDLFVANEGDLERKLEQFKSYYNQRRVHESLTGATPEEQGSRPISLPIDLKHYGRQRHCNGLFEPYLLGLAVDLPRITAAHLQTLWRLART
jgi:hypothetical protein